MFESADPAVVRVSPAPFAALTQLVGLQAQAGALAAAEVRLLVRAGGSTRVVRDVLVEDLDADGCPVPDRDQRHFRMVDEAVEEFAAALHRSPSQVHAQLETARLLAGPLTATLDALAAGTISYPHARVIADAAGRLVRVPWGQDPGADAALVEVCARLQARILPVAVQATVAQTRARAARIVTSLDQAAAAERRAAARQDCDVRLFPLQDGLAMIEAILPGLAAAAVMAAVDSCTHAQVADGRVADLGLPADAHIGEVRAAALTQLVTGNIPAGAPVELGVVIDAATLAGLNPDFTRKDFNNRDGGNGGGGASEGTAWVRAGAGAAGMVEVGRGDLLDLLGGAGVHATIRRLVTDPASGALVDRGARTYRVTDSLKDWIQARDVTCAFPGCNRGARACDIDHAVDFHSGGSTTVANTRALCRRHHNAKTHSGWQIRDSRPDGSCTFISPAGRQYHHQPVPLLEPPHRPPPEPVATASPPQPASWPELINRHWPPESNDPPPF